MKTAYELFHKTHPDQAATDRRAAACPSRVEITALRDDEARYVHGNCQPKEASP